MKSSLMDVVSKETLRTPINNKWEPNVPSGKHRGNREVVPRVRLAAQIWSQAPWLVNDRGLYYLR